MNRSVVMAFGICLLAAPSFALAQSSQPEKGTTSGPAAGSTVQPSTVTQKKQGHKANMAAGAPGMAAKKSSESGSKPDKSPQ